MVSCNCPSLYLQSIRNLTFQPQVKVMSHRYFPYLQLHPVHSRIVGVVTPSSNLHRSGYDRCSPEGPKRSKLHGRRKLKLQKQPSPAFKTCIADCLRKYLTVIPTSCPCKQKFLIAVPHFINARSHLYLAASTASSSSCFLYEHILCEDREGEAIFTF